MQKNSHKIAVIGGTGLTSLNGFVTEKEVNIETPYGMPSAPLIYGTLNGQPLIFLPRHGVGHTLPPHLINYRANIWALKQAGVEVTVAFAAVGGITEQMSPATLVIPDQIIDYTYGREHTFYDKNFNPDQHIDFTEPYDETLRLQLIKAAEDNNIDIVNKGVYAVAQGPRLETAAEIRRMEKDGCDLVGMTGMPEAALARELNMPYACCAVVVNWAAGKSKEKITLETIKVFMEQGMLKAYALLNNILSEH